MFNQQNIHHLLLENIENCILSKPHTLFDLVDPSVLIFKFFFWPWIFGSQEGKREVTL